MPMGADGKPMEVLINPLGVTSRTNPQQILEAALGKIAAKTGTPYRLPDFQNSDDMIEFGIKELEKHGMQDTETVTLADGRKVPGVLVGNRWMMKLHHMADDKVQGRGLGSYSSDGSMLASCFRVRIGTRELLISSQLPRGISPSVSRRRDIAIKEVAK